MHLLTDPIDWIHGTRLDMFRRSPLQQHRALSLMVMQLLLMLATVLLREKVRLLERVCRQNLSAFPMKPTSFSVLEKGILVLQGMKETREKKKNCKKNRRKG